MSKDVEGLAAIAEEELEQIVNKGYGAQVRGHGHVQSILQVYMAFYGKEVALECRQVVV